MSEINDIENKWSGKTLEEILAMPGGIMDKQSRYELQKVDCNCNDCYFMQRDFEKFKHSLSFHESIQKSNFDGTQNRMIGNAEEWKTKSKQPKEHQQWTGMSKEKIAEERASMMKKYEYLMKEAKKMRFVFDKSSVTINFGVCGKLNKQVSFLPNVLQLDTQGCFEHRMDHLDEETRNKKLGL